MYMYMYSVGVGLYIVHVSKFRILVEVDDESESLVVTLFRDDPGVFFFRILGIFRGTYTNKTFLIAELNSTP